MFCCTLLYAHSNFAIILMGKRELVALLSLSSWCLAMVVWLFLAVPCVCLRFVIVVFPDQTHLLFLVKLSLFLRVYLRKPAQHSCSLVQVNMFSPGLASILLNAHTCTCLKSCINCMQLSYELVYPLNPQTKLISISYSIIPCVYLVFIICLINHYNMLYEYIVK